VKVKDKKMLAVGEAGQGLLFDLKFEFVNSRGETTDLEGKDISSKHTLSTPVTVRLIPLREFDVNPVNLPNKNGTRSTKGCKGVFSVELIPDSN
jgi:hypothetical protein